MLLQRPTTGDKVTRGGVPEAGEAVAVALLLGEADGVPMKWDGDRNGISREGMREKGAGGREESGEARSRCTYQCGTIPITQTRGTE